MTSRIDRVNAARCLAKAMAYADCNKPLLARRWAAQLMRELQARDILALEWQTTDTEPQE